MGINFVEGLKILFMVFFDDNILVGVDDGEDFFDRFEVFLILIEFSVLFMNVNDMEDIVEVEIEVVVVEFVNDDVNDGDNELDEVI